MNIDFGWVLLLAGLAGGLPTARALLHPGRRTRTRWLRLIVHVLLVLLGALEIQRHGDWHPLRRTQADHRTAIAMVTRPVAGPSSEAPS